MAYFTEKTIDKPAHVRNGAEEGFPLREMTSDFLFADSAEPAATGGVLRFGQNFRLGITRGPEGSMVSRPATCAPGAGRVFPCGLAVTCHSGRRTAGAGSVPAASHRQLWAPSSCSLRKLQKHTLKMGKTLFSMQLARSKNLHHFHLKIE